MKVHLIGSLLCAGLLVLATSGGGYAASKKPKKEIKAGQSITTSHPKKKARGVLTVRKAGGDSALESTKNKTKSGQ